MTLQDWDVLLVTALGDHQIVLVVIAIGGTLPLHWSRGMRCSISENGLGSGHDSGGGSLGRSCRSRHWLGTGNEWVAVLLNDGEMGPNPPKDIVLDRFRFQLLLIPSTAQAILLYAPLLLN